MRLWWRRAPVERTALVERTEPVGSRHVIELREDLGGSYFIYVDGRAAAFALSLGSARREAMAIAERMKRPLIVERMEIES